MHTNRRTEPNCLTQCMYLYAAQRHAIIPNPVNAEGNNGPLAREISILLRHGLAVCSVVVRECRDIPFSIQTCACIQIT
jgi:hypothetical protein